MADAKISQLTSATALAGTEVVPVVQGGITKKATIDQILSPAAGKGIDFSANTGAAGMTSELLNWYEEGVWTPTWSGGSVTVNQSRYTRIGRQVTWIFDLTFGASASSSDSDLTLPFTVGGGWGAGSINFTDISATVSVNIDGTASRLLLRSAINAGNISCATAATKRIIGVATYFV
jgi:hypothetical protein